MSTMAGISYISEIKQMYGLANTTFFQNISKSYTMYTRSLAFNTRHSFIICPFKMFLVHCAPSTPLVKILDLPHTLP